MKPRPPDDPHEEVGWPHGPRPPSIFAANVDNSRVTFSDEHFGQARPESASLMRRSCSKRAPQLEQRYSYSGISDPSVKDAAGRAGVTVQCPARVEDIASACDL